MENGKDEGCYQQGWGGDDATRAQIQDGRETGKWGGGGGEKRIVQKNPNACTKRKREGGVKNPHEKRQTQPRKN